MGWSSIPRSRENAEGHIPGLENRPGAARLEPETKWSAQADEFALGRYVVGRYVATRLLQAAVRLARERGIDRILVTCDVLNPASARVIDKCGGVLQDRIDDPGQRRVTARYWIDV
jgi:RimJ/RimL family protein N-acetyltransferase